MSASTTGTRLGGGAWGPVLVGLFALVAAGFLVAYYLWPSWNRNYGHDVAFDNAMFGPGIEQPIAFSHRLHVTNKEIDCYYCHPHGDDGLNAGLPSVEKCLGCHDHIIPLHEEIEKLRSYRDEGEEVPWLRVYYNPDHAYFPHYRHLDAEVECQECHGEVEKADRLRKVTFYMGLCVDCHKEREASLDCASCHQ